MKMKSILLLCAVFGLALFGRAATPTTYGSFTNNVTFLTATTNTLNLPVNLRKDQGIAIFPYFAATNATAAGTVTLNFDVSYDGTNYTTTLPLTYAITPNGTTAVRGYNLFDRYELNHAKTLRLTSVANTTTNRIFMTNIIWCFSN